MIGFFSARVRIIVLKIELGTKKLWIIFYKFYKGKFIVAVATNKLSWA